jgi:putative colanic acid biosysnthesis UDP-glucose lipid carrier transferase
MFVPARNTSYLRLLLYSLDSLAIVAFLWLLLLAYKEDVWLNRDFYLYLSIFTALYCFVVFCSFSIYRSWYGLRLYREFILITKAWSTTVALVLFMFFALKISANFSRVVIMTWFAFTPLIIFLLHLCARVALWLVKHNMVKPCKAVIVGVNDTSRSIISTIETSPWAVMKVLGFFDDNESGRAFSLPIIGRIDELPDYLKANQIDYVYIALPMKEEHKIHEILSNCRSFGAELFLVPSMQFLRMYASEIQLYGDILVLSFTPRFHSKRFFDIVFSAFALICFLPLGLLIALLIKLEDGGPVFYSQKRITIAGKKFGCWKFRTMAPGADRMLADLLNGNPELRDEWMRTYKLRHDPRITRIGKILRRTSLDEFPQFFNVLKGDMSIVGARPIVEDELSHYYKDNAGSYCSMRPGITGLWQTNGRSDTENYEDRVEMDGWYFLNHSIWVDIKIILKTIVAVLTGKGAR